MVEVLGDSLIASSTLGSLRPFDSGLMMTMRPYSHGGTGTCEVELVPCPPLIEPFILREVFAHSCGSQEPVVNNSNTLGARLRRIAREGRN